MKEKNIIFSHESDIDGLGCIVLGKLAFDNVDDILVPNVEKLELTFRKNIKSGNLDKYDKIYVTDLALYDPALTMVAESSLKDKVQVFDHHKRAIDDNMNRYPFTKIMEEDKNKKRCGTELFYEYLIQNKLIRTSKAIDEFVELTRLEDTWEWKYSGAIGQKAHNLAILFNALGKENYITTMISKLQSNSAAFEFDEKELKLIQKKKDEYDKLLQSFLDSAEYFLDENGHKFGIAFSKYEYRNELAEYIKRKGNPEQIKYFIMIDLDKGDFGQKSYRSIDESFDVNEVASLHGGGGSPRGCFRQYYRESKVKSIRFTKKRRIGIFSKLQIFSK